MDSALGDNAVDIDLGALKRTSANGLKAKLTRLTLIDKDIPTYDPQEALNISLIISTKEAINGVKLRLTLRNDSDVGLGTAWSLPFDLKLGENKINFSLPMDNIAKGTFYASIGIYEDAFGRTECLDHITRAFKFEVIGSRMWSTTAHGYIALPELKIY